MSRAALVAIAIVATASLARAEDKLAALAPASDARLAVAIGPLGQVYEPDGKGAWARHHAGGISAAVLTATRGATVIAGARDAPPFKLVDGAWSIISLGLKAKALVGVGPRATAASGRHVFALDGAAPVELPIAPADVSQLGASTRGATIITAAGAFTLQGTTWKPLANAPANLALLGDRWALAGDALVDLRTGKTVTPRDLRVIAATVLADDSVVAVAMPSPTPGALQLVTLRAGKLIREDTSLEHDAPVIAVTADRTGRVVIALRDGRLALREPPTAPKTTSTWSITTITDDAAAPRPGPGPATTR